MNKKLKMMITNQINHKMTIKWNYKYPIIMSKNRLKIIKLVNRMNNNNKYKENHNNNQDNHNVHHFLRKLII